MDGSFYEKLSAFLGSESKDVGAAAELADNIGSMNRQDLVKFSRTLNFMDCEEKAKQPFLKALQSRAQAIVDEYEEHVQDEDAHMFAEIFKDNFKKELGILF